MEDLQFLNPDELVTRQAFNDRFRRLNLKNTTAAMFGLGADAVPDDVLAFLGKYNQHWWARNVVVGSYSLVKTATSTTCGASGATTILLADAIEINQENGAVSLVEPQTLSLGRGDEVPIYVKGKYFSWSTSATVFYVDVNAEIKIHTAVTIPCYECASVYNETNGETEIVRSSDRNAYPDSGECDGYEWQYLGVPFDNAVTAPRLAVGSYMGTGTYGADNPTSLTFEFEPQLLFVFPNDSWLFNGNMRLTAVRGQVATSLRDSGSSSVYIPVVLNWDGKTVSWHTTLGEMDAVSGADQLNAGNAEYFYAALG